MAHLTTTTTTTLVACSPTTPVLYHPTHPDPHHGCRPPTHHTPLSPTDNKMRCRAKRVVVNLDTFEPAYNAMNAEFYPDESSLDLYMYVSNTHPSCSAAGWWYAQQPWWVSRAL